MPSHWWQASVLDSKQGKPVGCILESGLSELGIGSSLDSFKHGSHPEYTVRYKSRFCKLHMQSLALVRMYLGTMRTKPKSEHSAFSALRVNVIKAWKHFHNKGHQNFAEILRMWLCRLSPNFTVDTQFGYLHALLSCQAAQRWRADELCTRG
jgi:hypothetical protein